MERQCITNCSCRCVQPMLPLSDLVPARHNSGVRDMKPSEKIALALILFGLVLHTYTNVVEASDFSFGFWLWSISP